MHRVTVFGEMRGTQRVLLAFVPLGSKASWETVFGGAHELLVDVPKLTGILGGNQVLVSGERALALDPQPLAAATVPPVPQVPKVGDALTESPGALLAVVWTGPSVGPSLQWAPQTSAPTGWSLLLPISGLDFSICVWRRGPCISTDKPNAQSNSCPHRVYGMKSLPGR